jgi:hypothetical protein
MENEHNAESVAPDERGIIVPDKTGECWNCGIQTHRIEVNYETWLCSPECEVVKDAEFEAAGGIWAGVERSDWATELNDGGDGGG